MKGNVDGVRSTSAGIAAKSPNGRECHMVRGGRMMVLRHGAQHASIAPCEGAVARQLEIGAWLRCKPLQNLDIPCERNPPLTTVAGSAAECVV